MTYTAPDFTDPFTIATAVALLALGIIQAWLIGRNQTLSPGRKTVRFALNGLLWLALIGYVLKIGWSVNQPTTHALLVGEDVPGAYARSVADSLHVQRRFTSRTFKPTYDSVTLVGQSFSTETLTQLSQSVIRWVPYDAPGQVQELRWKGVVRQGERQRVTGHIQSAGEQILRIRYGNQTLDSLKLVRGNNAFRLEFPVFGRGRIQTELTAGRQVLDTVRFYARPTTPLHVRFVLDNPDFESKTLAEWLGRQGHSVQVSTTLATNVRSSVGINTTPNKGKQKPDVVITDPTNAANSIVRNALADRKAVLFINLGNPPADLTAINRVLGTRWQVGKLANQETIPAGNNLTAHPFRFINKSNQFPVPGYPVAVQQANGRVGVSLLNETFPLALSGDSLAYSRIWYGILARLQPADADNLLIDAPVVSGLPGEIQINNPTVSVLTRRVGRDTVRLTNSPLNPQSAAGYLWTKQTGWQPVQDSLAVWVENTARDNPATARQVVSQFVRAHSKYQTVRTGAAHQTNETLSGWAWLTLFLVCLTALWVEPKIA